MRKACGIDKYMKHIIQKKCMEETSWLPYVRLGGYCLQVEYSYVLLNDGYTF